MNNLMKQASQMQAKLTALQSELDVREIKTSTGGGAIQITINGKQEIIDLKLDPECVDPSDVEGFEELLKTGINQAIKESQDMVSQAMSKVTGGLSIPGLF